MPIPDPRANEKKETYISRCMEHITRYEKDKFPRSRPARRHLLLHLGSLAEGPRPPRESRKVGFVPSPFILHERGGGGDDLPPPQLVALRPAPLSYNSLISHREEGRRHLWFPTIFGSYSRCSCISSRCSPSGSCTRSARTRRRPSTSSAAAGWGRGSRRCRRRRPTCRAGCSWACRAWPTSPVRPTPCGPPSALPSARISTGSSWRSVCGSIPWCGRFHHAAGILQQALP